MASKRNTKKTAEKATSKTQARKIEVVEKEEAKATKKAVDLDKMVEEKKTTGTAFQAYMRDCIKAGKVL